MADALSIVGLMDKVSDGRTSLTVAIDVAEDIENDNGGPTFDVPAGGSVDVPLGVLPANAGDFILVKTPQTIKLSATFSGGGDVTDLPVRGYFFVQTEGLSTLTLASDQSSATKVTCIVTERSS